MADPPPDVLAQVDQPQQPPPDVLAQVEPRQQPAQQQQLTPPPDIATSEGDDKPLPGFLQAGLQGLKEGFGEIGQSVSTLAGNTPDAAQEQNPLAQGWEWRDLYEPLARGLPKTAYRVFKGAPMLGGGILGGMAGTAIGGPGLGSIAAWPRSR